MLAAFPVFAQDIRYNPQPLQDLGAFVKEKLDRGELDLDQSFKVVAEVVLTNDGRFDMSIDGATNKPKSRFVSAEGDDAMVSAAKSAIEAAGNSGAFGYLKNLGADKLKITFAQDKANVSGTIESEHPTAQKAQTAASGLKMLMNFAGKYSRMSEDEKTLFSGFRSATSNEKIVIINYLLPKQTAHEILLRNLKKAAESGKW